MAKKAKTKRLEIRIVDAKKSTYAAVKELAEKQERTMSGQAEFIIRTHLKLDK